VTLTPGERVVVVGCAHATCSCGAAWVHGHRLAAGAAGALLRSLPDVGSTVVLEGGPRGAEVALRPLALAAAAFAPAAPCVRVLPYADAVAAGHATLLTQVRMRTRACALPRRRCGRRALTCSRRVLRNAGVACRVRRACRLRRRG
jgi:hypothetical protein